VTLKVSRPGYDAFETAITVTSGGTVVPEVKLTRLELFNVGDFAVYISAKAPRVDGVIVALGGPDTRGFSAGTPFGAPPQVEGDLQVWGKALRSWAASKNVAIVGTSKMAMANNAESDAAIVQALKAAGVASGRTDLEEAPLIVYGISAGAPEASGFVARHAGEVLGLFLKVPKDVELLATDDARSVPTYIVLAQLDAIIDNPTITAKFTANRRAGALWAIALEAGVPHHSLSTAQQQVTLNFISEVFTDRWEMGAMGINQISESSGWLGNTVTRDISSWNRYGGDRRAAGWFLSAASADEWKAFSSAVPQ
jgi:hypothetical protein